MVNLTAEILGVQVSDRRTGLTGGHEETHTMLRAYLGSLPRSEPPHLEELEGRATSLPQSAPDRSKHAPSFVLRT